MATHSSTLAWKIPLTEEPGRLQSIGSWRVRHDWATSLSLFTFMHWRRKWQPTPVFLPRESQGWRSRWAAVYGVAQSRTRLKWLSSSSSNTGFIISLLIWLSLAISVNHIFILPTIQSPRASLLCPPLLLASELIRKLRKIISSTSVCLFIYSFTSTTRQGQWQVLGKSEQEGRGPCPYGAYSSVKSYMK